MRSILGKALALVYATGMGILLYLYTPRVLLFANTKAGASFWVIPVTLLCLFAAAIILSLPLRGFLFLSGTTCGKFFAICCASLMGGFVTYELFHYMSADLFSGPVISGCYVLFGGIFMMACPIVAMSKYVS